MDRTGQHWERPERMSEEGFEAIERAIIVLKRYAAMTGKDEEVLGELVDVDNPGVHEGVFRLARECASGAARTGLYQPTHEESTRLFLEALFWDLPKSITYDPAKFLLYDLPVYAYGDRDGWHPTDPEYCAELARSADDRSTDVAEGLGMVAIAGTLLYAPELAGAVGEGLSGARAFFSAVRMQELGKLEWFGRLARGAGRAGAEVLGFDTDLIRGGVSLATRGARGVAGRVATPVAPWEIAPHERRYGGWVGHIREPHSGVTLFQRRSVHPWEDYHDMSGDRGAVTAFLREDNGWRELPLSEVRARAAHLRASGRPPVLGRARIHVRVDGAGRPLPSLREKVHLPDTATAEGWAQEFLFIGEDGVRKPVHIFREDGVDLGIQNYMDHLPPATFDRVRRIEVYAGGPSNYGFKSWQAGHYSDGVIRLFNVHSEADGIARLGEVLYHEMGHGLHRLEDCKGLEARIRLAEVAGGPEADAFYLRETGHRYFESHWMERFAEGVGLYLKPGTRDAFRQADPYMSGIIENILLGRIEGQSLLEQRVLDEMRWKMRILIGLGSAMVADAGVLLYALSRR